MRLPLFFRIAALLLAPAFVQAADDYDALTRQIYVIRNAATPSTFGIWQFDVGTRQYRPWRPLRWELAYSSGMYLSAFPDRVVVLGPAALEFDLATARLLRRYDLMPPGSGAWHFHGQIVSRSTAM